MRGKLPRTALVNPSSEIGQPFHIAIVYDDTASGRCAMETYQWLLSGFGREFDFHARIWRFGDIQASELSEDTISDAIKADAIILATLRPELPIEIKRWVDAWAGQKRGHTAVLIALLAAYEDSRPSGTHDYLKRAAANAGMDFLVQEIQSPSQGTAAVWKSSGQLGSEGWGLNE
jgi:hypothetical protein